MRDEAVIQGLDIGLLPYLVSIGAFSERNAKFVPLASIAWPAKPDGRHGAGATSGWGITRMVTGSPSRSGAMDRSRFIEGQSLPEAKPS